MSFKPDPAASRKFIAAARASSRALPEGLPPVLYLTDPDRSPDLMETISKLPMGWGVVYRHFGSKTKTREACTLRKITWQKRLKLLIGNDPELACFSQADGVHWPESRISNSRYWRSRFSLMTWAAHSRAALARGAEAGLDAVLLSTVFPSSSASASAPMGQLRYRFHVHGSSLPIYALGGITAANAAGIASDGGLAAISGIEKVFGV